MFADTRHSQPLPCLVSGKESKGIKRDKLKGTSGARILSQICADLGFCFETRQVGRRRFSQKTAEFSRKPQEPTVFRRNALVPLSLSLLIPLEKKSRRLQRLLGQKTLTKGGDTIWGTVDQRFRAA